MKKHIWTVNLSLFFVLCMANWVIGMEPIFHAQGLTEQAQKIHRELLGKVKKLEGYDDIYVGAGYSAAGESMFFGMEKLDDERVKVWKEYADVRTRKVIIALNELNSNCRDQEKRQELEQAGDFYRLGLMDTMCANRDKFVNLFERGGMLVGIVGFNGMLNWQKYGHAIYVAYASTQPITSPFKPKNQIDQFATPEEFEAMYPDIIISIGVELIARYPKIVEHRGIFKNPFFEIKGTYKNIAMKLHGWAGTVEEQIFDKTYMIVYPSFTAAELLHRSVKTGDMYIGIDSKPYPYKDEELRKNFPSIPQNILGGNFHKEFGEVLHVFDLNVLSKYYTE